MKKCLIAAFGAACVPVVLAQASRNEVEQVIVTASRVAEPLSQTLASATVIDRASIEARQFQTLDEVLATAPGVALANNGGVGKISTLFIRGAESDQNLVLVNGVRIGSTTAGIAAIQDIPLEQIERIELVRGPRWAAWCRCSRATHAPAATGSRSSRWAMAPTIRSELQRASAGAASAAIS
jgi:vitamin B12 transporter